MNEGDSAGGGHQGPSPAPPAVPIRRPNLTITTSSTNINTSNVIANVVTAAAANTISSSSSSGCAISSNTSNQNISGDLQQQEQTNTAAGNTNLPTSTTTTNPRSFQQAFTQLHQQQSPQPHTNPYNSNNNPIAANIATTAAVGLPILHMPQNSASINLTAAPDNTVTPVRSLLPQQQHITASDSPPPQKRPKFENLSASLTESSLISGVGVPLNVVGSLLPATTTGSTPDLQQKGSATNTVAVAASSSAPAATTAATAATTPQDFQALKKRILEYKYLRLRSLKEKHNENVAELFYLQSGGNMMEYPAWRKKPPTQQLMSFNNAYRLNQLVGSSESTEDANTASGSGLQQQQPTAENIATIIGVASSSVVQQQQLQQQHSIDNATKGVPINQSLITPASDATAAASSSLSSSTSSLSSPAGTLVANKTNFQNPTNSSASGFLTASHSDASSLPQGAEIKIPAVGATPVAVSTKLPDAVVQLSQQGGTPLVPATLGGATTLRRNGQSTTAPATPGGSTTVGTTTTPPPPLYTPTATSALLRPSSANGTSSSVATLGSGNGSGSGNSAQEFSFKAKQEVYVMQRISELQREGLWTEKRLPKLQEPSRPKAHWDYLLEEMVWLATDFAQERKWKKNAAKKCARMVQKYFQDKANAAQKAEKAQEAHQRRVAAFIAKEIKYFWSNVEKLVEYKHHTKLEEKRKKALDQHLSFIVDQTEKFSQQLAEGMNKNVAADASGATSVNPSRRASPKPTGDDHSMSDDDFRPDTGSEDDEETIAKAEKEEETNVKDEVAALEKESQMEFDDFLNDLPPGYLENREKLMKEEENRAANKDDDENDNDDDNDNEDDEAGSSNSKRTKLSKTSAAKSAECVDKVDDDKNDADFEANEASEDDENTLIKQEAEEMDVDHKKEIDELEADNDLTVEELLEKYKKEGEGSKSSKRKQTVDSDDDDDDDDEAAMRADSEESTDVDEGASSSAEDTDESEESEDETATEAEGQEKEDGGGLKSLLEDESYASNNKDDMIKDAAALAESIQPKGNTLSSTDVVTPVPFLLKHSLREYQHIGLDWLVTMNERKLNGILADEMGLGKTIQTIALLAHLACVKGNWGPHLIVVPSSVMLNWEMEFKKWCPGFKILTYYGTQKERKLKRVGWTKPNAFHVCITSYKLVVQDQQSFRRKKWKYLILDEAQNIKNFKSQRWQLLLNFSTERRLLLTGTPLQNDLMELWSLMHFLMPYVFSSHREFKEWFSNPMTGMIEGNMEYNETLISRLHKVIRPFLLRRLKKEVEKQMPKKYEHVVMCRLSNRQRYLYDDFMSRAKTKETLQTGNLLSVINVLMQLRKVCNHPNMFEVRPTISPFQMEGIIYQTPRLVCDLLEYDPFTQVDLRTLNSVLIQLELTLTAYASYRSQKLGAPRQLIEEIDSLPQPPPSCPTGKFKFHIRVRNAELQQHIIKHHVNSVRVGASPAMKTEGNKLTPVHGNVVENSRLTKRMININPVNMAMRPKLIEVIAVTNSSSSVATSPKLQISALTPVTTAASAQSSMRASPTPAKIARLLPSGSTTTTSIKPFVMISTSSSNATDFKNRKSTNTAATYRKPENPALLATIAREIKSTNEMKDSLKMEVDDKIAETAAGRNQKKENDNDEDDDDENDASSALDPIYNMTEIFKQRKVARLARLKLMAEVNRRRLEAVPIYGEDCRDSLAKIGQSPNQTLRHTSWQSRGYLNCQTAMQLRDGWTLSRIIKSYEQRFKDLRQTFANFVIYVPSTCAPRIRFHAQHLSSTRLQREQSIERTLIQDVSPKLTLLHPIISAMTTQFPDPRLIQYDCGKLQTLDRLLRQLKTEQHRVLIFTQMTKMLDVLEAFLNYHGHIYLRLDGSTRVEQRQVLMERFNGDKRIFCFILSTRSGGVGVNLTGADTVIFYDSDWNPTMDAQAQDRCHRIGQTRDVHIYRLVSEKTIEVNILKKANQKRMLSDMAIEGGNFTTTYFKSSTIKDLFNVEANEQDQQQQVAATVAAANDAQASSSSSLAIEKAQASTAKQADTLLAAEVSNAAAVIGGAGIEMDAEKQTLRVFESALAAAEDEQDVQATKTAKAEAAADLAEFDETIPLDETTTEGGGGGSGGGGTASSTVEMSRADLEMQNLVKQLSPIERYAMRFVEETGAAWTAEQLRAAEEEIEAQKREWEANRLAAMQKEEEMLKQEAEADDMLTYNRRDAGINQIWISPNTMEVMPMWCPPTPPQDDNDLYIDYSLSFMYDMAPIPDSELPPVYVKKDYKRSRADAGYLLDGNRRPAKMRKEDNFYAPRSLFDRPMAALARIRRDLKNQRYRGVFKPNVQIPNLKPAVVSQKPAVEPEVIAEWSIFEDIAIVNVLVNLQGLPCNLMTLSPGHTPNWDLVAEIVNMNSKTYRSPKQCRWRYETVIQPREEGKLVESPKKQKKLKAAMMKSEYLRTPLRYLRTTQLYVADNNTGLTKVMRSRFDCIKAAYLKKAPPPKRHFSTPSLTNPKHMEVLQDYGVLQYDHPLTPLDIASIKANKMREKQQRSQQLPPPAPPGVAVQQQQQQQQVGTSTTVVVQTQQQLTTPQLIAQQQQHQSQLNELVQQQQNQQQQAALATAALQTQQLQIQHITASSNAVGQQAGAGTTAIVLQHAPSLSQQQQQQQVTQYAGATTSAQAAQLMRNAAMAAGHQQTTAQIVKAIVTPQSGVLTAGQMQQLTQQAQHVQLQQTVGAPASVSVVLTTPVQTLSPAVNVSVHQAQQLHSQGAVTVSVASAPQMVSISPQTIVSSGSTQVGSIVQTLPATPTQSMPQVVSVSQLATVGTVLTTSANQAPNATVTTINASALRAQRIVTATQGTLQDVVLQQQRGNAGNQNPTIVSMSSLGQAGVSPSQFQAAQLRLASMPAGSTQQVTTKGGVSVNTLQQANKIAAANAAAGQPTHIQLYRQRQQQIKVLQTSPAGSANTGAQTVVQTASGQTALVNAAGTIIQGSLMQAAPGQSGTVQLQGQKVAVATVSTGNVQTQATAGGVVTSVATAQVVHNQGRTQFIKQVSSNAGKQTITRQSIGGDDMLLVKRQVISASGHPKTQVIQQSQIFTTTAGGGNVGGGTATMQIQQQQATAQQQQQQQQTQVQQVTPQQIATLVKASANAGATGGITVATTGGQGQVASTAGTVNMALSALKPGQIKVTMANQSQMRQLQMQQHLGIPRKIRMTQIPAAGQAGAGGTVVATAGNTAQAGGVVSTSAVGGATLATQKSGGPAAGSVQTQLVHIQNPKSLSSSVTVQQIQQVMRQQGQQGALGATGLVLGKTSVGRVIPVSVSPSQGNQRQTIQVVSAASAQALAAGNIRAHGQNIAGTIKVATAGGSQSHQALINAIQQQASAQQSQRQAASPVRLQTTASGNLVAVVQQQTLQQQQQQLQQQQQQQQQQQTVVTTTTIGGGNNNSANVGSSSISTSPAEVITISQSTLTQVAGGGGAQTTQQQQTQQQQPQQTTQATTTQQVRTLVKKKIMQIRSEKE